MTIDAVNALVPRLTSLMGALGGEIAAPTLIKQTFVSPEDLSAGEELKQLFDALGSDKGQKHKYHRLYGHILKDRGSIRKIFEIGLGTNNTSVVSNMGAGGYPGASLRAFRDFCPQAQVMGADFDRGVLFEEERIRTFFVDQTDPATFLDLAEVIGTDVDLFIDDGLHAPHANLASLEFGLGVVKPGGWVVIEDIAPPAVQLWQCVSALLPDRFRSLLLQGRKAYIFAVQRLA